MKEGDLPIISQIQTKYIITTNKSIKSNLEKLVDLKKGDIVQGIEIIKFGNLTNDSGSEQLVFKDKEGNIFQIQQGFRGFVPFFQEYQEKANENGVVAETFYQKHKNHLLIALALVVGYFAYKKIK